LNKKIHFFSPQTTQWEEAILEVEFIYGNTHVKIMHYVLGELKSNKLFMFIGAYLVFTNILFPLVEMYE